MDWAKMPPVARTNTAKEFKELYDAPPVRTSI